MWAPAKLNLFLEVLGKRPDGFHELETVMVSVGLCDTVDLVDAPDTDVTSLDVGRSGLPTDDRNLVVRAAELLRSRARRPTGVRIRLHKRIAVQAGLGGGSSDAAATLVGLNCLWRLGLPTEALEELCREL